MTTTKTKIDPSLIQTLSLATLALLGLTLALYYLKNILLPLVLALFLTLILNSIKEKLMIRLKIPPPLSLLITLLLTALLLFLLTLIILSNINSLIQSLNTYRGKILSFAEQTLSWLQAQGVELDKESLIEQLKALPLFSTFKILAAKTLNFISSTFLVLIFTGFLLASPFSTSSLSSSSPRKEAERLIRLYLMTKITTSAITATLVGLTLYWLGLDLSFLMATLVFFLNFIPTLGSIIATLIPLPLALLQAHSWVWILLVLLIPATIQFFIGNVVEPKILGDQLKVSPLSILLSLLFWTILWGPMGALLSVPILICLTQLSRSLTIGEKP